MNTDFFTDEKYSSVNISSCMRAIKNPNLFDRIEICVLNAKTQLAKRRLVRAIIVLQGFKAQP